MFGLQLWLCNCNFALCENCWALSAHIQTIQTDCNYFVSVWLSSRHSMTGEVCDMNWLCLRVIIRAFVIHRVESCKNWFIYVVIYFRSETEMFRDWTNMLSKISFSVRPKSPIPSKIHPDFEFPSKGILTSFNVSTKFMLCNQHVFTRRLTAQVVYAGDDLLWKKSTLFSLQ